MINSLRENASRVFAGHPHLPIPFTNKARRSHLRLAIRTDPEPSIAPLARVKQGYREASTIRHRPDAPQPGPVGLAREGGLPMLRYHYDSSKMTSREPTLLLTCCPTLTSHSHTLLCRCKNLTIFIPVTSTAGQNRRRRSRTR